MHSVTLRVHKLGPAACDLTRGSALAAGLDVSALHAVTVPARGRVLARTGLRVACPPGWYVRVAPRSGLALKKGIDVGAGVVDADYRGELGVVLFNLSEDDVQFAAGDKIAQLILERIPDALEVAYVDDLDNTDRGAGGFGSSDANANTNANGNANANANSTKKPRLE